MARRPREGTDKIIPIRVRAETYQALVKKARDLGTTVSGLLRASALELTRPEARASEPRRA